MSMSTYACSGYGVILNGLLSEEALDALAESDVVSVQSSFSGESYPLKDNGTEVWDDNTIYEDESLYFIGLPEFPSFFRAAYPNMDALVESMKKAYDAARAESLEFDPDGDYDDDEDDDGDSGDGDSGSGGDPTGSGKKEEEEVSYALPEMSAEEIRKNVRSFIGSYYG